MDSRDKVTLSTIYLMLGIGGLLGAASSTFLTLLLGLPHSIIVCAILQAFLGAYALYRYFLRSKKEPTVLALLFLVACFVINGGFAMFQLFQLAGQ